MVAKKTGVGVEQRSLVRLGIGHVIHEHEQDCPIYHKADTNAAVRVGMMVCLTYEEGGVELCAFTRINANARRSVREGELSCLAF